MKKYFNYVIMAVMSIIITVMGIGLVDANTRVDNLTTKNMELKNEKEVINVDYINKQNDFNEFVDDYYELENKYNELCEQVYNSKNNKDYEIVIEHDDKIIIYENSNNGLFNHEKVTTLK